MKIAYDLDGVIRALHEIIEARYNVKITGWYQVIQGKDVFQILDENLDILSIARPTEYYPIIRKYIDKGEIWTAQKPLYVIKTLNWINQFFDFPAVRFFDNSKQKYNKLMNMKEYVLIEDCPEFADFERIVLINKPYNIHVYEAHRIFTPEELEKYIKETI